MSEGKTKSLGRLLQVLRTEERQRRGELEAAQMALSALRRRVAGCVSEQTSARCVIAASIATGQSLERIAAVAAVRLAQNSETALAEKIPAFEEKAAACREHFLQKRMERRQVETLYERRVREEAEIEGRRSQQRIDDWYLTHRRSGEKPDGRSQTKE